MRVTATAQVWLAVAESGKCTVDEIQRASRVSPKHVADSLRSMVEAEMVTRFADGRYGVTKDSVIPRGLMVGEVLRATGATK